MLADVVEKLRRTGVQDPGAKAEDVECDVCTGKKHRAVKFCVKCQTLYCEIHVKIHNERNRSRMHPLIEVTKQAQKRICSRHNKLRDVYCRTDQQCICSSCLKDGHKGHSVVSVMEERMEKQVTKTVKKIFELHKTEFEDGINVHVHGFQTETSRGSVEEVKAEVQGTRKGTQRHCEIRQGRSTAENFR